MGLEGRANGSDGIAGVSYWLGFGTQMETDSTTLSPSQLHGRCGFENCLPIVFLQTPHVGSFGADHSPLPCSLPSPCPSPCPSARAKEVTGEVEKDRKILDLVH